MCRPRRKTDSPHVSSSSSSSSAETEQLPLELIYVLQFSGATNGNGFSGDAGASTSTGNAGASTSTGNAGASTSTGNAGASTSTGNAGASTSTGNAGASTSTGNAGASTSTGNAGASTSTGNAGASTSTGNTGASTSSGNGFYGPAGAAAVMLVKDVDDPNELGVGLHVYRQGLGNQTISVAQYRGLILGLTESIKKLYKEIIVQGNSELVVNQFQGLWEIDDPELKNLCAEAVELSKRFESFSIHHIDENLCNEVYNEALRAISLPDGQVEEE